VHCAKGGALRRPPALPVAKLCKLPGSHNNPLGPGRLVETSCSQSTLTTVHPIAANDSAADDGPRPRVPDGRPVMMLDCSRTVATTKHRSIP